VQLFVVLNPVAGRSHATEVRQALARHFDPASWQVTIHETKADEPVDAAVRASVDRGVDMVVAAGGDGTLSAVVDGLANSNVPLGILPTGTTNVVAQELNIPLNLDKACQLLAGEHKLRAIDALQFGQQFYVLSVGIGLDALAMQTTSQQDKRRYGKLAYVWGIIKLVMGIQPHAFTIVADGQKRRVKAADVLLTNVSTVTGPLRWGPHIAPDDGQIDIVIMRARNLIDILGVIYDILVPGRPRRNRNLRYWSARNSILVFSEQPLPVQGDGDLLGNSPVEVQIWPGLVQMIVPVEQSGRRWPSFSLPGSHSDSA
jgi:YegS/Rv2252/BmrU family lipid kinase